MKPRPKPLPKATDVRIDRIGAEADGLARLPDGTLLVIPRTLPGETVIARPVSRTSAACYAQADAIVTPAESRVMPPCPHFARCGGCALQHWRDTDYRAWKAGLLAHALRGAGFAAPDPLPFHPGLPGERRRLDFAVRRIGTRMTIGLHAPRSADIVDLTDCLIVHPALMALIQPLRQLMLTLQAIRREASLVINLLDAGPDLMLRTDAEPALRARVALTDFARAHAIPRVSVAVGKSPPETVCALRPATTILSGVTVAPPPGAFLQATREGESAIVQAVLQGLPAKLTGRIAELYAGCGTLTFALAGRVRVAAFEGDAAAFAALRHAVNQATLAGRIEPVRRDLVRQPLSAKELGAFAAVVLDPPHAGAAEQMAQIVAARVPAVIYVSCNPGTLSRDARMLHQAGYHLHAATAIDQFLWSARLESVCVFHRG